MSEWKKSRRPHKLFKRASSDCPQSPNVEKENFKCHTEFVRELVEMLEGT